MGWALLGLLLASAFALALSFDPRSRPFVGDEATFAMQAESLAFDLDLLYTRADYDRFVAHWGRPPDGLILQTGDHGRHLTFGKPWLYALAIAPVVRFAPLSGPLLMNALFLAAGAVLAGCTLRRRLGAAAPWWIAALVFASVAFAYVFWIHADLFLMAAAAAGLALAYGAEAPSGEAGTLPEIYPGASPGRSLGRWLGVGALLAIPGIYRPFYFALLLPAALAIPARGRARSLRALVGSVLLVLALAAAGSFFTAGSWTSYGGERRGFYSFTGYPEVDFSSHEWPQVIAKLGNSAWTQEGGLTFRWAPRLWGWDAVYFLVGRDVGVLPYFLPLLLGFLAWGPERGRWALALAVLVAAAGFVLVRPFNFYGGAGAIGDRYFLPLYPAFWFMAARPRHALWALVAAAGAAPFLWPLWQSPRAFPLGEDGRYAYVSPAAQRVLPYETTLSHFPGGQDLAQSGLWLRFMNRSIGRTGDAPWLLGGETGELLVGSPHPLKGVVLSFGREAPTQIEVQGGRQGLMLLRPTGGIALDVVLGEPSARHPMWWTWDDWCFYKLRIRLPGPAGQRVAFTVAPMTQ